MTRNFGHHPAILAGLQIARYDLVFLIDSDLEEAPELLVDFLAQMQGHDVDVVYGVHDQSSGKLVRRLTSRIFWKLFNLLSEVRSAPNICNVRLMKRRYVDALLSLPERNVFLGGLLAWTGFEQRPVLVQRKPRPGGSTYTTVMRFALMTKSLIAFSTRPLLAIFLLGMGIFTLSLAVSAYLIIYKLVWYDTVYSGFTTVTVSIWLLGGLTLSSLGLVGFYLAHVYTETKGRPRVLIKAVHSYPEHVKKNELTLADTGDQLGGRRVD